MTREEIIKLAREAGLFVHKEVQPEIELFATLIAKHTLANIDPRSFMSWQEGYDAGAAAEQAKFSADLIEYGKAIAAVEREACAKVCEDDQSQAGEWTAESHVGGYFAARIRARGQA